MMNRLYTFFSEFHENDSAYGSDKLLKMCLLSQKYAIFIRVGACLHVWKKTKFVLEITVIFIN